MFTMRNNKYQRFSSTHRKSLFSSSHLLMSDSDSDSPGIVHRVYDEHELAAIHTFKDKYLEATTPAERKTIAQIDIFPGLFNYWKSIGKVYKKKETRMRSEVCVLLLNIYNKFYKVISLETSVLATQHMESSQKGPDIER